MSKVITGESQVVEEEQNTHVRQILAKQLRIFGTGVP